MAGLVRAVAVASVPPGVVQIQCLLRTESEALD